MKSIVFGVAISISLASRADARPSYSKELTTSTLSSAKREIAAAAAKEDLPVDMALKFLDLDVFAISDDTGCPGIDVDVVNNTDRTIWAIEIKITQREGTQNRTDTVHLPYLTAKSETRLSVSCVSDYTYRSRYDYNGSSGITIDYSAKGARTLADALVTMQTQRVDYRAGFSHDVSPLVSATPDAAGSNLLAAALAMDDADVAKELVAAIVRTGAGAKELGAYISNGGEGPILEEIANGMSKLPPAQQADLARVLIGSEAADKWKAQLLPLIDRQLCGGPRPGALALWIQANYPAGIPNEALRERVLERCAPRATDGPAIVAAIEKRPDFVFVLDTIDPKLFASVAATWKASKSPDPSQSQLTFVWITTVPERFDQATATIAPASLRKALESVAMTAEAPVAAHKAKWVRGVLASLEDAPDSTQRDAIVGALYYLLVEGKVLASAMREAVRDGRSLAPNVADRVLAVAASEHSKVFDAGKLAAAGVDLQEFLAFNKVELSGCLVSVDQLRGCMTAIGRYKAPAGTIALDKAGADTLIPDFLAAAKRIVDESHDFAAFVELGKAFAAIGVPTAFITDRMCRDAQTKVHYGEGNVEQTLGYVEQIDPAASCIASTRGQLSSKRRSAIIMTIVAILGMIIPLPASGFWMRRRWRKLEKTLPQPPHDTASVVARLDERLGATGVARALPGGIADAKRELAGTAAGRALETVTEPMLARVIETLRRAVSTGDAASVLLEGEHDAIYVVALPVRHARPQVIQRYLGGTWPEHLASIQRAAGRPVLALVVLCGPDVEEASLLVGHHDGARSTDPEVLLDARDARERGANRFHHVMPLTRAA